MVHWILLRPIDDLTLDGTSIIVKQSSASSTTIWSNFMGRWQLRVLFVYLSVFVIVWCISGYWYHACVFRVRDRHNTFGGKWGAKKLYQVGWCNWCLWMHDWNMRCIPYGDDKSCRLSNFIQCIQHIRQEILKRMQGWDHNNYYKLYKNMKINII